MMLATSVLICAASLFTQGPELNEQNLSLWRDHIRPKAFEVTFEDADWKPTFQEAVVEAQNTGKPILLWAMNGHPLACT